MSDHRSLELQERQNVSISIHKTYVKISAGETYRVILRSDIQSFLQSVTKNSFKVAQYKLKRRVIPGIETCSVNWPPYNIPRLLRIGQSESLWSQTIRLGLRTKSEKPRSPGLQITYHSDRIHSTIRRDMDRCGLR